MFNKKAIRKTIIQLLIVVIISLATSCSINRVYGMKKDDFLGKVSRKDYSFIYDVDYLKNSIKEVNRLGRGASYYMSFVYKSSDMLLFSNKLLYQEMQNRDKYFGPKAATQLLKQLLQERDFIKAEALALDFFDLYKGDYPAIRKQFIEAIYWQKKDSQVIPYIDNLDRSRFSDYANYELDMLKVVSSARLGVENWEDGYRSLFFNQPLSPLLSRAFSFIDVFPDYGNGFSSSEKQYFKALAIASNGDYSSSQEILRALLYNEEWIFKTEQSIKNIARIIKDSGYYINVNTSPFKYAMDNYSYENSDCALTSYASLYFNMESFSNVVSLLENDIQKMPLGKVKDDAIWLYLLSLSHIGQDRIVSKLALYIEQLTGEEYATDILDHVITALVQNKEWDSILEIRSIVERYGDQTEKSRISWIISRLYSYKYLYADNYDKKIEDELDKIVISDNFSYYSYIANALLKRESNLVLPEPKGKTPLNDDDKWIKGFINYGLEDEALLFSKQLKVINYSVAIDVAKLLTSEGKHLQTLRFLNSADVPLNIESFPLYYPLPYKDQIINISTRYNFPSTLFSGLIRTESGFDMEVVSSAGAVGLSQLMPETAIEQANDLGISYPDLNDPDTNILLGGTYIDWLIDRFYSLPISFMGYNAGPGNVKKWQRMWGDLPDELFIEAAPFIETRNYVPKIIKAAIYYGHEEYNVTPYEVVKQIFNDI